MDVLYKVVFFQYLAEVTGSEEIKELGLKARWQSYESALWLFLWMKWSQSAVVFSVCICHPVGGSRVRASCYSGLFRPLWLHLRPRLWFSAFERTRIMNQTPAWMFDAPSTCFWSSGFSLFSNQTGMCTYREHVETEISVVYWMLTITVQLHSKLLSILH